jgi:hypothetical protein
MVMVLSLPEVKTLPPELIDSPYELPDVVNGAVIHPFRFPAAVLWET